MTAAGDTAATAPTVTLRRKSHALAMVWSRAERGNRGAIEVFVDA